MDKELAKIVGQLNKLGASTKEVEAMVAAFEAVKNNVTAAQVQLGLMALKVTELSNIAAFSNETFADLTSILRANLAELSKTESFTNNALKSRKEFRNISQELVNDENGLVNLSEKQLIKHLASLEIQKGILETSTDLLKNQYQLSGLEGEAYKTKLDELKVSKAITEEEYELLKYSTQKLAIEEAIINKAGERLALQKDINKATAKFAAMADIIGAIPGLRKLAPAFKEAEEAAAAAYKKTKNLAEANAAGMNSIVGGITRMFASPMGQLALLATAFKGILNLAFKVDTQITEISKSQGKSYKEAAAFREELSDAARGSGRILETTQSLVDAQTALSKQAGVTAGFKTSELQAQVKLTKYVGIAAEAGAKLGTLARVSKISMDDTLKGVIKQTQALKFQNGVSLDNREILEEVANTSGRLAANYKNNPVLIGAAVVQARRLGLTLEQAAAASKGLLDFESSISNELEAELLTGKELNLEKARYLALQGKSAEAAVELAKNFGSLKDFQDMNILAQDSLAKAVNMTADELATVLLQQQNLNSLGENTKKQLLDRVDLLTKAGDIEGANRILNQAASEKDAKAALERAKLQDRFNGALDKAKDIFASLIDNLPLLVGILTSLAVTMALVAASSVVTALALTGGTAAFAIAGGLAVVGAGLAAGVMTSKNMGSSSEEEESGTPTTVSDDRIDDGIIDPQGGLVVSGQKGSIQLNKQDSIIAGTNLNGSSSNQKGESAILAKLEKLIAAVEKGGNVYMDGNKVGEALVLSSYKLS